MKKYLLLILILLMPTGAWATNYYACNAAQNVTGDSTWCTAATVGATCTKASGDYVAWATVVADSPTLYANGCTVVVNDSFTAVKISVLDGDGAGNAVAGGSFTAATATMEGKTITADIEGGAVDTLVISGSTAGTPVMTIVGDISGPTASSKYTVNDTHTVGTIQVTGDITGSNASLSAIGYYLNTSTGLLTITGNSTGGTYGPGVTCNSTNSAGYCTITGNCIGGGSTGYNAAPGCTANGTGPFIVIGNIVASDYSTGANGKIRWTPATPADGVTGNYISIDGGGTPVFAGKNTDDASKALNTFYYIDPTDGTSDVGSATTEGGGGGAFAW